MNPSGGIRTAICSREVMPGTIMVIITAMTAVDRV